MRTPRVDKDGLKQGSWTAEEDQKLIDYITRYRIWNWSLMPKFAGLSRSGKSCRFRWVNYLNPNIRRGNITKEEEQIIIDSYVKFGSRWSKIVARLPGRTDNEIKNYWHTHLKKLFNEKPTERMKSLGTEIPKVEANLGVSDGFNNLVPAASASQGFHNPEIIPVTGLDDFSYSLTIGDFRSLWAQTFFDETYHMEPERQEPYTQEWYQEENLSPNGFFNNEYWFNDFPVMNGAEQPNAYFE